jgi:uncharacterized protein YjgD (DUF1641 family)
MAKPIAIVPIPADNQQGAKDELLRKLDAAPLEHASALLALWELLEAAHQKQLLEIATGAIAAGDTIVNKLAEAAANPGAIQGLRNLIILTEMLGSLDPESLRLLVKALPNGLHETQAQAAVQPPSRWQIFRQLSSADSRRALAMAAGVAASVGAAIGQCKPPQSAGKK